MDTSKLAELLVGIARSAPRGVRVPGLRRTVGLGTAVSRVTTRLGVKQCQPCKKRADALDRAFEFRGKE